MKMHGTGNDFIVLEAKGNEQDWPSLAQIMCHRHLGIGADGLLLILPSTHAHVKMRIFNPDGSEAEMCGNGIRCLVRYALDRGLVPSDGPIRVETLAGIISTWAMGDMVRVAIGVPRFHPSQVPVRWEGEEPLADIPLEVGGHPLRLFCLSLGNPHAVHLLPHSLEKFPLGQIGPQVERHPLFPKRVNFEVAEVVDRGHMRVRVWERGAGETLACGTGATAAAIAARVKGLVDERVEVQLPGGVLRIEWDGEGEAFLAGPAEYVFQGEWLGPTFPLDQKGGKP